eukprot:6479117-Amphidinium_carterae.1
MGGGKSVIELVALLFHPQGWGFRVRATSCICDFSGAMWRSSGQGKIGKKHTTPSKTARQAARIAKNGGGKSVIELVALLFRPKGWGSQAGPTRAQKKFLERPSGIGIEGAPLKLHTLKFCKIPAFAASMCS